MKLGELKFDTPSNACLSLRILAEHVRTGAVQIHLHGIEDEIGRARVDFRFVPEPKR